jgi:glycosyltransferase involved in cell wall biosynthesis
MFIVPLIRKAAAIITIDNACDQLVRSILINTVGRVIRSSVAVNTAVFKKLDEKNKLKLRQAMAIPYDAVVVVFAGRLEVVKGLELLIESFTIFDKHLNGKCLLYICGDGSQQSRLQKLAIASAKAGKITFTGALAHNQLTHYFQAADIFAMASHHEGLPNVILEAMSSGLPVVATDVGGISSVIKDGETGFLTRKRDSVEYAGLLLQAFRLKDSLGERAKNLVQCEYATEVVVGKIEKEIETLMQSNG